MLSPMVYAKVLAALWIVFWLYWMLSAFNAKKSVRRGINWRNQILYRLVLIALVILAVRVPTIRRYLVEGNLFAQIPAIDAAGILLCMGGMAFAVWARIHIGRNWGVPMSMREEPELVESGPYRWVRHPIYGGFLVAMLGTALIVGRFWILIFVLCLVYFIFSAKKEEELLSRQFPDGYKEYIRRTKRFIPFVI